MILNYLYVKVNVIIIIIHSNFTFISAIILHEYVSHFSKFTFNLSNVS